jgi:membrane protein YqaA with SNARE-associated domain
MPLTSDPPSQATPPTTPAPSAAPRGGFVARNVYRLLAMFHRWAESGWGGPAVGGWGFLQGSVMPGPTDTVLVPLGIADPGRVFRLALWATAGATLGGLVAYAIGVLAFDEVGRPLLELLGVSERLLEASHARFDRQGWLLVLVSTVSPLSSKVICLAAGAFGVPVWEFVPALLVGRLARFGTIAVLVRFAGPKLLDTLSRRAGVRPTVTRVLPLPSEASPPG